MHPNNVGRDIIGESDDWGDHGLKYAQIARESRIANSKKVQNFTSELLATYNATTPNEVTGYTYNVGWENDNDGRWESNRDKTWYLYPRDRNQNSNAPTYNTGTGYYAELHNQDSEGNPLGPLGDMSEINTEFENWTGSPGQNYAVNRGRQDTVTKYSLYVPRAVHISFFCFFSFF